MCKHFCGTEIVVLVSLSGPFCLLSGSELKELREEKAAVTQDRDELQDEVLPLAPFAPATRSSARDSDAPNERSVVQL